MRNSWLSIVLYLAQLLLATAVLASEATVGYRREAVNEGQWWLLLTAGYAHLGWTHLALNFGAIALTAFVQGPKLAAITLSLLPAFSTAVFAVEHFLYSHAWALGLSGAVHAMATLGLACMLRCPLSALVGALAVGKAGLEWWTEGSLSSGTLSSASVIGGAVLHEHHLTGVLVALCLVTILVGIRGIHAAIRWAKRKP